MTASASPIGLPKAALDTPALLVDLDVMEANIARIAGTCRQHGVGWRPHIKGHKTPEIARKQLAAGAIGVTCAKLGEAEVMAAAGITEILIANQIVGPIKVRRLIALLERAPVRSSRSTAWRTSPSWPTAAQAGGRALRVVDRGQYRHEAGRRRCRDRRSWRWRRRSRERRGLRFVGLIGWESHAVTIADPAEKERVVAEAIGRLTASADACRRAGHDVEIVSCGGTGTFPYCAAQPGVTEVQVGGAIFSDMHYRNHYHLDFPCALTLLATVTSRPTADADRARCRQEGDERRCRPARAAAGCRRCARCGCRRSTRPSSSKRRARRPRSATGSS